MTQPVVEDGFDDTSYVALTIGTVASVALVAAFLGTFIYMVARSLGRMLLG